MQINEYTATLPSHIQKAAYNAGTQAGAIADDASMQNAMSVRAKAEQQSYDEWFKEHNTGVIAEKQEIIERFKEAEDNGDVAEMNKQLKEYKALNQWSEETIRDKKAQIGKAVGGVVEYGEEIEVQADKTGIGDNATNIGANATDIGAISTDIGKTAYRVQVLPSKPVKAVDYFPYMCEIGKRTDLTYIQKVQLLHEAYYDLGDGNRKDIHCPLDAKFLKENGFTANGYSDYDWPDRWGFRDDYDSITRDNNKLPNIMDRNGSMGGNSFTELPMDRDPYTYDEMSLPYIPNPEANHRAEYARLDGYYFDVIDAIRNNDLNSLNALLNMNGIESVKRTEMYDLVQQYNDFIHDAKRRGIKKDATYGIFGYVDEWVNKKTGEVYLNGGAPQYTVPLTVDQMIQFGIYR